MKNFIKMQLVAFAGLLILSACSTSNDVVSNNFITKRKHNKGFHIDFKKKYDTEKGSDIAKEEGFAVANDKTNFSAVKIEEKSKNVNENKIVASTNDNNFVADAVVSTDNVNVEESFSVFESNSTSKIENGTTNFVSEEKSSKKEQKITAKHTFKSLKKLAKSSQKDDTSEILILILCFLIPPLAVYLHEGSWNNKCWISLILTCLFWVPGIVFALIVCLDLI